MSDNFWPGNELSNYLIVLSELPLTTRQSRYWRHAMPRLCPFNVRTNSQVDVLHTYNLSKLRSF